MPEDLRTRLITRLLASWSIADDPVSQTTARAAAMRDVDTMLAVLAEQVDGDLRNRITEALTREHYRRAHERIEASPEEHCAAFADVALAVRDTDMERLRAELAEAKRHREQAENRAALFRQQVADEHARAEQAEAERDRYRLAWQSARKRAKTYAKINDDYWRQLGIVGDKAIAEHERAEQAEAAIARAERLRNKWLTYPTSDMHHAAGLMLAKHLSGEAFGSDASTTPESRPANSKEILSGSGSAPESPQEDRA